MCLRRFLKSGQNFGRWWRRRRAGLKTEAKSHCFLSISSTTQKHHHENIENGRTNIIIKRVSSLKARDRGFTVISEKIGVKIKTKKYTKNS